RRAIDIQTIVAVTGDRHGGVRSIDAEPGALPQLAQIDAHVSGGDIELQVTRFVALQAELRILAGADERLAADLQLELAVARRQRVAGGQRNVQLRGLPISGPRAPEQPLALVLAQPPGTGR